jgi:hypothetical protein
LGVTAGFLAGGFFGACSPLSLSMSAFIFSVLPVRQAVRQK